LLTHAGRVEREKALRIIHDLLRVETKRARLPILCTVDFSSALIRYG
jgi:hypothetical protein